MSAMANIHIIEDDLPGVWLYTHHERDSLPKILHRALARKLRWHDAPYLARIIFDEMTAGKQGEELGFGISGYLSAGGDRILTVDVTKQIVSNGNRMWTFEQYAYIVNEELLGWD